MRIRDTDIIGLIVYVGRIIRYLKEEYYRVFRK